MADTTTTTYSLTKPEVGASADTWGTKLNTNLDTIDNLLDGTTAISPNLSGFKVGGTTITSTGAELNILDGVTATASEINKLDGLTATTTELNYVDGVTSNIQTQLNSKQATMSAGAGIDISSNSISIESDLRDNVQYIGRDGNDYIYQDGSNIRFYINGAEDWRMVAGGTFHADGDVIAYSSTISDRNLKKDIKPIEDALSKVNKLNGCTFTYTSDNVESAGLIAQEVEEVLPSAVKTKELVFHGEEGKQYKVLQYDQTIGLLVEAIKELTAKVEELENK